MWRGAGQRRTWVAASCLWGRDRVREGCSGGRGPRGIKASGSPYPSATSRAPLFLGFTTVVFRGMLNTSSTRPAVGGSRVLPVRAPPEVRGRAARRRLHGGAFDSFSVDSFCLHSGALSCTIFGLSLNYKTF